MTSHLSTEFGTIHKRWTNRFPVALIYPNTYSVAVSNLGFQIIYSLLNSFDDIVCERFVYPETGSEMKSLESGRSLHEFNIVFGSISFEEDYSRLAGMLAAGKIEPFAKDRDEVVRKGSPLVVLGGVAVFMNPEPLALFADCMVIGEGEAVLPALLKQIIDNFRVKRSKLLRIIAGEIPGCYVPSLYTFEYDEEGKVVDVIVPSGIPERVKKIVFQEGDKAAHSSIHSPEAELNMFMVELGRGCSRGCRFCAAGYIYRPPRLWEKEKILKAFSYKPEQINRIGLLGMEMAHPDTLDLLAEYLTKNDCLLSFSSLRADHISDKLLGLLASSNLKSVAIAPDGASERLRTMINKGLTKEDLVSAAVKLSDAGIMHLKLYIMIGLPTECEKDFDEFGEMIFSMQDALLKVGRKRGSLTKMTLSVNSFVPKPWTPFQYCSFGGLGKADAKADIFGKKSVMALKQKIKYLRKIFVNTPNLKIKVDRPERVLQQAVYSRADRRIAPLLLDIGGGLSFKQAVKKHDVSIWQYAVRPREQKEKSCWEIIDHGIRSGFLYKEFEKSMGGKSTPPCQTSICKSCGVC